MPAGRLFAFLGHIRATDVIPRHLDDAVFRHAHRQPTGARAIMLMAPKRRSLENAFDGGHERFRAAVGEMVASPEGARRTPDIGLAGHLHDRKVAPSARRARFPRAFADFVARP